MIEPSLKSEGHGCQAYTVDRYVSMIKQASKILSEDTALLRRVQIYYSCHKFSGQKLKDIGLHFGIGVSGVFQSSRRVGCKSKTIKS